MSQLSLLSERKFGPLFWTQFLGALNDNLLKNAMVILIAFQTGSVLGIPASQMVAAAGGIFILPFFLFSATAGQLSDKYPKGILIRWVKLCEIGIMALATAGFVFHQFELLLFSLFLMGLHSTFFGPLKYSILPQLLDEKELLGGNALIETGTFLAILLGTIGGGVLVAIQPNGPAFVSALLLAVSIAGYLTGLRVPETPAAEPSLTVQWNPFPPTWEILRFTRRNRTVFLSVLGISWFWFFGAAFLSLFPPYATDFLHGRESVVTLFLAIFSVGIGVGSYLCERVSRQRLELGLVPLGSIGMTLFAADLFLAASPFPASAAAQAGAEATLGALELFGSAAGIRILFDLLMVAISGGFFIVPLYTLIQERSEPSHRSRVIAANNILNAVFMVVASLLLMAMMMAGLTIPEMFLVIAVSNAAVAVYIYSIVPEFFYRFLSWILAHSMYRLQITGLDRIPRQGAAVLVCNHVSFVDWLIIFGAIGRPVRFVMDFNYAPGWVGRFLTRRGKVIPIATSKEDPSVLQRALDKVADELKDGQLVCIFPEGRLTSDGNIAPFRPGIERIISRSPVPVIPMALEGLWGSFFSREGGRALAKAPRRFWSRIGLLIGDPVPASEVTATGLFEKVRELRKNP